MSLKAIWSENTAYSKFLLTVAIILISVTFFTLISLVIASVLYGVGLADINKMMEDFSDPKAIPVLKFIQVFSTIGAFILPAFFLAWLFSKNPREYLSLNRGVSWESAVLVILAVIFALPAINYLGELNSHLSLPGFLSGIEKWMRESEDKAAVLTKYFLDMHSVSDLFFNILMIGLLPAIGEELLFRGVVQRIFSSWLPGKHMAIWLTAIIFSAMHFQFYGFLPRMMLGALLGYLLLWSGSLWLPILAHFTNNTAAILLTYLFREEMIGVDADKIGTQSDFISVVVSIALTSAALWYIMKRERHRAEVAA